jgi:S-adenosylmethionine decarboxylase proenzyme
MKKTDALGVHVLLELNSCNPEFLDNVEIIRSVMRKAADAAQMTRLGEAFHKFTPQGASGVLLLAESHISIHTWPEIGYASVDLYTCNLVTPTKFAVRELVQGLGAKSYMAKTIYRGKKVTVDVGS